EEARHREAPDPDQKREGGICEKRVVLCGHGGNPLSTPREHGLDLCETGFFRVSGLKRAGVRPKLGNDGVLRHEKTWNEPLKRAILRAGAPLVPSPNPVFFINMPFASHPGGM